MLRLPIALALALALPVIAQAQPGLPYEIKRDVPRTGSRLLATAAKSDLPFDKGYDQLTPAQQASIKSRYEQMGPGDEPPYPLAGTKKIWQALVRGGDKLGEKGTLRLAVDVDADGKPTAVTVLQTPGDRLAKYMAAVLMQERYKGALCDGVPCAQQFLFAAQWVQD